MSRWDDAEAEFYGRVVPAFLGGASPAEPAIPEPSSGESVWYRGWEAGYEPERGNWTGEGYVAYKGGCDEGAPQAHGATWAALLEAVDDEEDDA